MTGDETIAELVRIYDQAVRLLADDVLDSGLGQTGARVAGLARQIDEILFELTGRSSELVQRLVEDVYVDSSAEALQRIRDEFGLPESQDLDASFGLVDQDAVEALAARAYDGMADGISSARKVLLGLVRNTQLATSLNADVRREVAVNVAAGRTRRELSDRLTALIAQGKVPPDLSRQLVNVLGGIRIQVGAVTLRISDYAELVARTMQREAATRATAGRIAANGLDIAEVSVTRSSDDSCVVFEGLLVSVSGATEGFPSLSQLPNGGPPFHPRCTHSIQPRSLELLTEAERKTKTRIRKAFLGKSYAELERKRRKDYGGNADAMRRAARA